MHEVAEPSPITFPVFVLSATCLAEVRDWGELRVERSTRIPPIVQVLNSGLCFCFPFVTGVHITDQMVTNIVTYLFRIVSAITRTSKEYIRPHAHGAREGVQTSPTRSTGPRKPHQNPPEVPLGSNGRPDHGLGYGKRSEAEWFARMRV